MSGPQLAFFVPGHPETQGSKIAGRTKSGHHFVRDDNPDLEPWRDSIVLHARAAAHAARVGRDLPHAGPVDVDIWSYFARRKGHLKADGHTLRDTAPAYPIARGIGDVDKLVRAVLDSLTKARVIADDVLVVDVHGYKRYADPNAPKDAPGSRREGAVIVVRPHLEPATMLAETAAQP